MADIFKLLDNHKINICRQKRSILNLNVTNFPCQVLTNFFVVVCSFKISFNFCLTVFFRQAIPMVMGANIGTSVTNTIVSIAQVIHSKCFT
jgi:hypothetical protein